MITCFRKVKIVRTIHCPWMINDLASQSKTHFESQWKFKFTTLKFKLFKACVWCSQWNRHSLQKMTYFRSVSFKPKKCSTKRFWLLLHSLVTVNKILKLINNINRQTIILKRRLVSCKLNQSVFLGQIEIFS